MLHQKLIDVLVFYLSCGSHSLPDTEVTDNPGQKQTQAEVPLDVSQDLYAGGYI